MADKFNFNKDSDIRELMNMLDEMQNQLHAEEVEEILIDTGHVEPVRPDAYIPPAVGDSYDTSGTVSSLADMLINPEDMLEIEEQRNMERKAQLQLEVDNQDEQLPPPPAERHNPLKVLGGMLASSFPRRADSIPVRLIKCGAHLGFLALLAAVAVLLLQLVALPMHNRQYNDKLAAWFNPDNTAVVDDTERYPEGMMASFKKLYSTNNDVKGWLSFHADGEEDFLNIEYPVVQTDDNTTYVEQDFHGRYNRNGTLFFDEKCHIGNGDSNRSLILYGNTMGNGQMLSGLNNLVSNEAYARQAYSLTLNTLYEQNDYYVFAVLLRDKEETVDQRVLPLHHRFITTDTFFDYVQDLRDRSLFDYPTDIVDTDSILLMVTDLGSMNGVVDGMQVIVAARRARPGEQPYNASDIGPNEDVLMPYRWYQTQSMAPPDIYRGKETTTTTLPTNNPFESTTDVSDGSTTATTETGTTTAGVTDTTATTETGTATSAVTDTTTPTAVGQTTTSSTATTGETLPTKIQE